MSNKKEKQPALGETQLINQTWEWLRENSDNKVTKSQLAEEIKAFLHAIEEGLAAGNAITFPGRFGINTVWTQETIKPNLQKKGESITVPAQRRIKFRVSSNWKVRLNPILQLVSDLKQAKNLTELEKVYKTLSQQEVYKINKKHLDRVYGNCETNLKTAGRK
jgi:nucleoid DNA-binding protein